MSLTRVRLLGAPTFEREGAPIRLTRRKAVALLAYLAVTRKAQTRERLAELLWPELERPRGLAALRRALRTLAKAFGPTLSVDSQIVAPPPNGQVWVDVTRFEELLKESSQVDNGPTDWTADYSRLRQAAKLYVGDFLNGFSLRDCDSFEEWQFLQRDRLRSKLDDALKQLVFACEKLGNLRQALSYARRRLQLDDFSEDAHRQMMRLYAAAGDRGKALRQYEKCAAILSRELKVEPDGETRKLYEAIRTGVSEKGGELRHAAVSASRSESPSAQVAPPEEFGLPQDPSSFVGRSAELHRVQANLNNPDCRLVTIVGPGGIGKTRLAAEACRRLPAVFPEIVFVPVASVGPELLLSRLAESLNLRPHPRGEVKTQLLNHLAEKRMLLLLDNFEHLVGKAGLISEILGHCPRVKVLATSRERLNLRAEWLVEIQGLDVPEPGDQNRLEEFSAARLFLKSVRRVREPLHLSHQEKRAVIDICRLVGGSPLALELAAAWARVLSCSEIAREIASNINFLSHELRDLPARHRSLRAVFDSSLKLLESSDQTIVSKLAVFHGGWTREAAEAVAEINLSKLLLLTNKSLLRRSASGRFQMHELIRQFALQQLRREVPEASLLRDRHARHYLDSLRLEEENFKNAGQKQAMQRMRTEMENVRAAWLWALKRNMISAVDQSLEALFGFHVLSNRFAEGESLVGRAAAEISRDEQPLTWARLVVRQVQLRHRMWDSQGSAELLNQTLSTLRRLDVPAETALNLQCLSRVHSQEGDFATALELTQESVALFRAAGDRFGMANSLVQLARIKGQVGDYEASKTAAEQAYSLFETLGDSVGMGRALLNLGNCSRLNGQSREAIRRYERSIEIFTPINNVEGIAVALNNSAMVYEELGEYRKAKAYLLRAVEMCREIGVSDFLGPSVFLESLARTAYGLAEFEESKAFYLETVARAIKEKQKNEAVFGLIGLARFLARQDRVGKACECLFCILSDPRVSQEARLHAKRLLATFEPQLPTEELEKARHAGSRRPFDQMIRETLACF